MKDELSIAFKEANSFVGLKVPNDAQLIGMKKVGTEIYNLYKDSEGNYWYDTESGRKFELELQEKQKIKKIYGYRKSEVNRYG